MTTQRPERPRRVYAAVETAPSARGVGLFLDGRPARTPGRSLLELPTPALAEAVAQEWRGQGEVVDVSAMPLTRLAFAAVDRGAEAGAFVEEILGYAGSDLLCYRAEGGALAEAQEAGWGPILAWLEETYAAPLRLSRGIAPVRQPQESLERLRRALAEEDAFALAGLAAAASLFGSAALALAARRGRLTGPQAFDLSRLDEAHQEARWGVDAEAAERTERLRAEARALGDWFSALGPVRPSSADQAAR